MRSLRDRRWLAGAALCPALLCADIALAAERLLVLEVVINQHATGRVGEFIDRDGVLYVQRADLAAFGLMLPPESTPDAELIPFSSLPHLRAQVDEARQALLITADDAALRPVELGVAGPTRLTPLTPAQFGALLNYDAAATYSDQRASGGALVDLRLFGPYGVVESSALVSIAPADGERRVVRLDTSFTFTEHNRLRRWRVGDVITGALPWTRAVRLGGAQVASDFGLRPDLVTYPLPRISSSAAVPSTVNVMVNGVRQLSEEVQAGPFAINTLPVVSGAGEVSVTLLDALGQPTIISTPFYASTTMLRPGLASYSLEVGAVREDYGLPSDRYSGWAINQSSRFGVTDWLTLESHAEAASGLALAGAGAAVVVGTLGIATLAVAGSASAPEPGEPSRGGLVAAGFQRVSRRLSLAVSGTVATSGFRDIAAAHGAPVPKSTINASAGYQLGRWGSLGVAYSRRIAWRRQSLPDDDSEDHHLAEPSIELITGSYNVAVPGLANLYATGFKDLRADDSFGVGVGLSFPLGGAGFASLDSSFEGGRANHSVNLTRTAHGQGDFGYRIRASHGAAPQRSVEGEYVASWGHMSAGIDHFSGQLALRAGARGALVLADGELFASDRIHDSFAIVSTGDVGGVPVFYENRPVGRSNRRGKLLIPMLRAFQDNRLSLDSRLLPADVEVARTVMIVRPADRSGVTADFGVRKVHAAMVTLQDAAGRPVPLGAIARIAGADDQPVGHDGAAYVTGLKPANRMQVALPNGSSCAVEFAYTPVSGDIPLIGPLRCQ